TDVKLLTVSPCGAPLESTTLAIVTPVAKRPHARRNSSLLTGAPRPGYLSLDMGINSILSCGCLMREPRSFRDLDQEADLIKLDIINEVVNRTGITKTKAEMAVETVFESMKRSLERGERIELRGFGIFNVRPRKTGIGRNPRTGAEVAIPPGKAVRFKPGKELQQLQYRCAKACCDTSHCFCSPCSLPLQ